MLPERPKKYQKDKKKKKSKLKKKRDISFLISCFVYMVSLSDLVENSVLMLGNLIYPFKVPSPGLILFLLLT